MASTNSLVNRRRWFAAALAAVFGWTGAEAQTSAYVFSHFVGTTGGAGYQDGPVSTSRFCWPSGVATDAQGNLFVTDRGNRVIRKVSANGDVTTLAGKAGEIGTKDGIGADARFTTPTRIAFSPDGNLYVGDGSSVRKITPAAVVSTVCTGPTDPSFAFDAAGNTYITDSSAYVIWKLTPGGELTVYAGARNQPGFVGGTLAEARFSGPTDIAADAQGNLYVAEPGAHVIRIIGTDGMVRFYAGRPGTSRPVDGPLSTAELVKPSYLAVAPDGVLYVLDVDVGLRKVTAQGVTTIVRASDDLAVSGWAGGMTVDATGTGIYLANYDQNAVWRFTPQGARSLAAGAWAEPGHVDGTGDAARFFAPQYLARDGAGNLYTCDAGSHVVRKITANGVVSTLAGSAGQSGSADGAGTSARFYSPTGITVDASGNLFVVDRGNGTIRKIDPAGNVSTFAGGAGLLGTQVDAVGTGARFQDPDAIAIEENGNLFVTDGFCTVRKITSDGAVSTFAGGPYQYGMADGVGASAQFNGLAGIAVGSHGALYVADRFNHAIRKITSDGTVTTLAGTGLGSDLNLPRAVAVDSDGNLFITEWSAIRRITQDGVVTTLAGLPSWQGAMDGSGQFATFFEPHGIAVDEQGRIYVADTGNQAIRRGELVTATLSWAPPAPIASGVALSASQLNATANVAGTFTYTPAAGTVLPVGEQTLTVTFAPLDARNFPTLTRTVTLTVRPASYAGVYFGTFGDNRGNWALNVRADNSGTFIGYLSGRSSAVVAQVQVASDGSFSVDGTEIVASSERRGAAAAGGGSERQAQAAFSLSATIAGDTVAGRLGGIGETLAGAADRGSGTGTAGYYAAHGLNTNYGTSHVIVGPGGGAFAVLTNAGVVDAASGTIASDGRLSVTTAAGATLTATLNPASNTVAAVYTPANSGAPVEFAGLADGIASTTRPMNISARAYCSTGNSVTIGGFVVTGSAPKRVLIRAVGPTLTTQGIGQNEVLQDPMVEVHHRDTIVAQNDNWGDNVNAAEITSVARTIGANALASSDTQSSALLTTLDPGVYTFVVRGKNDTSGIVLLEVYDADTGTPAANFVNISARAQATTGNGVAIGGFVISGNAPKRVLLRAVGPTLTTQGIGQSEALADPLIELHRGAATIATNDDWGSNTNQADIVATGARIGATPFAAGDTCSSALLMTLRPGVYTFIAKGKNDTSGIVLVEVYDAD